MKNYSAMTIEQLLDEFQSESQASERCINDLEIAESNEALAALRAELVKRASRSVVRSPFLNWLKTYDT